MLFHDFKMGKKIILVLLIATSTELMAQISDTTNWHNDMLDSLYINEVEEAHGSDKVLHAEPLYIDLIRDLGARKGEKEWNLGLGMTDRNKYDSYTALLEYEWAPVNRLGLEVELPFTIYHNRSGDVNNDSIPSSKLNGLKLAAQYTFFVSLKHSTSLAIGYLHEFAMVPFDRYSEKTIYNGNIFNPFFVAAKRWGENFHTLVYTGPVIENLMDNSNSEKIIYNMNANFHYMIDGTRNFVGIEFNNWFQSNDYDLVIRPQMRVSIAQNLLIGIVTGIPIQRESERLSTFIRIIYEPGRKLVHKHIN
jgi:hypothetical protein